MLNTKGKIIECKYCPDHCQNLMNSFFDQAMHNTNIEQPHGPQQIETSKWHYYYTLFLNWTTNSNFLLVILEHKITHMYRYSQTTTFTSNESVILGPSSYNPSLSHSKIPECKIQGERVKVSKRLNQWKPR